MINRCVKHKNQTIFDLSNTLFNSRYQIFVEGHGFLSFAENLNKSLCGKFSQTLILILISNLLQI